MPTFAGQYDLVTPSRNGIANHLFTPAVAIYGCGIDVVDAKPQARAKSRRRDSASSARP